MEEAPFSAPYANQLNSAVEGSFQLPDESEVVWALSRREFGPMSFQNRPTWDITHNRMKFLRLFNLKIDQVISPKLSHGTRIQQVSDSDKGTGARHFSEKLSDIDGLITRDPDVVLMTTHADCMPLWMCVPSTGWIGLAHVGWRGLYNGIVENLIRSIPENEREGMVLGMGPSIDPDHYQVGEEVAKLFLEHPVLAESVTISDGDMYLDLPKGVRIIANTEGVVIQDNPWASTFNNDYLSSFRREGASFQPMAAFISRVTE